MLKWALKINGFFLHFQQNMYQNRMPGYQNQCSYNYQQQGNNWSQNNYPGNFSGYSGGGNGRPAGENGSFDYNNQWQPNNWAAGGWHGGDKQVAPGSNPNCDNNSANGAGAAAPVPNSTVNYQRTFDYVQQCQNWTDAASATSQ